jgi:hypothetical protein
MPKDCPKLPIPEPLRGTEVGTFTEKSIVVRLPEIGRRTITESDFSSDIQIGLNSLIEGIPHAPILPLAASKAPDIKDWNSYIQSFTGMDWLTPPWFFVETYFYRRFIDITDYFDTLQDPFAYQKERGYASAVPSFRDLTEKFATWVDLPQTDILPLLFYMNLWGNQSDLSLWPIGANGKPSTQALGQTDEHILADDIPEVCNYLFGTRHTRLDIILDNVGTELITDLLLALYLLDSGITDALYLHTKFHPTFVSDATPSDVHTTITRLSKDSHPYTRRIGIKLQSFLDAGIIQIKNHPFWTSPLAFWDLPQDLRSDLGQSNLLIFKGDANYRRLLGDRHWPFDTPFSDILCYAPAPVLALRVLKCELLCGVPEHQTKLLMKKDSAWLYNGKYSIAQFHIS